MQNCIQISYNIWIMKQYLPWSASTIFCWSSEIWAFLNTISPSKVAISLFILSTSKLTSVLSPFSASQASFLIGGPSVSSSIFSLRSLICFAMSFLSLRSRSKWYFASRILILTSNSWLSQDCETPKYTSCKALLTWCSLTTNLYQIYTFICIIWHTYPDSVSNGWWIVGLEFVSSLLLYLLLFC